MNSNLIEVIATANVVIIAGWFFLCRSRYIPCPRDIPCSRGQAGWRVVKMKRGICLVYVLCGLAAVNSVRAGEGTILDIDEKSSFVDVEFCLSIGCDSDTSAVDGFVAVDFDSADPNQMFLVDFNYELIDPIMLTITTFGGAINVDMPDVSMMYAVPGDAFGPSDISGGTFDFVDVPVVMSGFVSYEATGTVCAILDGQGIPCVGGLDLSLLGVQMADSISGTIDVDGVEISMVSMPDITTPIDPKQPDLGSLSMSGTVLASGTIETLGDSDGDGDVDLLDFAAFVDCVGVEPVCVGFDFDEDGDVDFADARVFQLLFTGP